jgi:hypothetical protein
VHRPGMEPSARSPIWNLVLKLHNHTISNPSVWRTGVRERHGRLLLYPKDELWPAASGVRSVRHPVDRERVGHKSGSSRVFWKGNAVTASHSPRGSHTPAVVARCRWLLREPNCLSANLLALCPSCGKGTSPADIYCPNCGHQLRQASLQLLPNERVSALWWLLPSLFILVGGIISYLLLRDRNRKVATHTLVFGIIWTFLWPFVVLGITGLLASL